MKNIKLYEDFVNSEVVFKHDINFDLINDAKELSLDYLDEGLKLYIGVVYISKVDTSGEKDFYVYVERFSHSQNTKNWYNLNISVPISVDNIYYRFIVYNDNVDYEEFPDKIMDLVEILTKMYPEYEIFGDRTNRFSFNSGGSMFLRPK